MALREEWKARDPEEETRIVMIEELKERSFTIMKIRAEMMMWLRTLGDIGCQKADAIDRILMMKMWLRALLFLYTSNSLHYFKQYNCLIRCT